MAYKQKRRRDGMLAVHWRGRSSTASMEILQQVITVSTKALLRYRYRAEITDICWAVSINIYPKKSVQKQKSHLY